MKLNKNIKRYCPHCKKHTKQVISTATKKDRSALKLKTIYAKKRISGRSVQAVLAALEDCQAKKFCGQQAEKYYGLALEELEKLPIRKEYIGHYTDIAHFLIRRDF